MACIKQEQHRQRHPVLSCTLASLMSLKGHKHLITSPPRARPEVGRRLLDLPPRITCRITYRQVQKDVFARLRTPVGSTPSESLGLESEKNCMI